MNDSGSESESWCSLSVQWRINCGSQCQINGGLSCDIPSVAVSDSWIKSESCCSCLFNGGENAGLIVELIVGLFV